MTLAPVKLVKAAPFAVIFVTVNTFVALLKVKFELAPNAVPPSLN